MTEKNAVPLSANIEGALSFERYGAGPAIEGVVLRRLRKHRSENGWFAEIFRLNGGAPDDDVDSSFELRQLSASSANPYRLNAFHIHPRVRQDERWIVIQGALSVWLVDCRDGSATEGVRQRVHLTAEEPGVLSIPSGVAHGYRAGKDGAILLYGMNQQFDLADPNEGRLPWDHFGAELWAEDRG